MKVRIGFGLGRESTCATRQRLAGLADMLEQRGFDSLWLSERLSGPAPDPITAMAFVVARTERLKVGTSIMVLPGRNLAVLAGELATLDRLAGGRNRVLPSFGLGASERAEHEAFGVPSGQRASMFDEALPLLRRFWAEDRVTHHGDHYHFDEVTVGPKPTNGGFDVWIGAMADAGLRRVGRLADGWLASFCLPADVTEALPVVHGAAAAAGRTIDPDHIGVPIIYRKSGPLLPPLARQVVRRHPDLDPDAVVPPGLDGVVAQIEGFIEVGVSKFVVLPTDPYENDDVQARDLDDLVARVLSLET